MTVPLSRRAFAALLLATSLILTTAPLEVAAETADAGSVATAPINVGILLFDGLFITEFVAPFDVYKHAGDKMNVFSIAPTKDAIRTYEGVRLEPDYSFADAPKVDVLVVPSGINSVTGEGEDQAFKTFISDTARTAKYTTSHCWGAFSLARAGLLDGKEATTFPTSIDQLGTDFPALTAVTGKRFVEAGNIVTSNGGLAAFEASLNVVEKLLGEETAKKIAAGLVFAPDNVRLAGDPRLAAESTK